MTDQFQPVWPLSASISAGGMEQQINALRLELQRMKRRQQYVMSFLITIVSVQAIVLYILVRTV